LIHRVAKEAKMRRTFVTKRRRNVRLTRGIDLRTPSGRMLRF
jgi:hypothetical protein